MIRNIIFDMVGVLMRFDTESTEALFLRRRLSGALCRHTGGGVPLRYRGTAAGVGDGHTSASRRLSLRESLPKDLDNKEN